MLVGECEVRMSNDGDCCTVTWPSDIAASGSPDPRSAPSLLLYETCGGTEKFSRESAVRAKSVAADIRPQGVRVTPIHHWSCSSSEPSGEAAPRDRRSPRYQRADSGEPDQQGFEDDPEEASAIIDDRCAGPTVPSAGASPLRRRSGFEALPGSYHS
jgi:hypothetical protein